MRAANYLTQAASFRCAAHHGRASAPRTSGRRAGDGAAGLAGVPQRDWARGEHYDEVMATLKAHCSIY